MNTGAAEEGPENRGFEGPGKRLKALRESQNIGLGRVASLLHLNEDKLRLLEAEDYENLPGSVFIQGYIRNYARLLEVPSEPLINAFRTQNPEKDKQPELRISQVRHEVHSSHLLVRLMTWIIVIGLVVLVVIWWRGYLQWPLPDSLTDLDQGGESPFDRGVGDGGPGLASMPSFFDTAPDEDDSTAPGTLSLPGLEQLPVSHPSEGEREAGEAPPETADRLSVPPQPASTVQEQAAMETPEPETTRQIVVRGPVEQAPRLALAQEGRVVVLYSGKSWTRINDSSGSFKIQEEMDAGSRRVLQGVPPYSLVLGNAAVVEIQVDGRVFDLAPYIRGNVARFTLDPDRIVP